MQVVFLEPLGISQEQLKTMVAERLENQVEVFYYDT